jgi:hypothetical protein
MIADYFKEVEGKSKQVPNEGKADGSVAFIDAPCKVWLYPEPSRCD